jgi:hypothetical protein
MPITSTKNFALTGAATDLGLGDALAMQTQNETDDARKKRMRDMKAAELNPAAMSLLGGGSDTGI